MKRFWLTVERLAVQLLPRDAREPLRGDLDEEGVPIGRRRVVAVLDVAAYAHAEPWRDLDTRLAATALLAFAGTILHAIPTAARLGTPDPSVYSGPLFDVATFLWSSDYLVGAVAAGLLVGHAPGVSGWAAFARAHIAAALIMPAAWLAPHAAGAMVTAAFLVLAAWFGARARTADEPTDDQPSRLLPHPRDDRFSAPS